MTSHESDPTLHPTTPTPDAATVDAFATTLAAPLREGPGTRIGPYRILQLIGEGGFGSVFMAQQEQPVQRKVALKIIKLGMDTRQVVARFEQERQALAMMDHPGIARVLDAGATETGRPYFVMELVKGDPISEYCDKQNLTIQDRLDLFAQVCTAVQHAHTKGIIHRDIKPSNVLVSMQDGRPHAKVIDFGIAKATSSRLTEKTLFTEHRQLIGTPEYMSPEQAEGSLDIDTRTDVYSLGVLLYELLTGTTPFPSNELRSAAYAEIQRIIREVDPPKPSTRLSQNAQTLASIAARRHTEPRRLGMILRGELDWIVMKAMEKDRQRRYETANGLAADVRRYLAGEAVLAAPPGSAYRVRKFIVRHRATVCAGSAVAAALLIGVVAFAWQARVARQQRDIAVASQLAEAVQRKAADEQRDRAVAAEAQTARRADELQKVSEFQASMLSQIDATEAGEKLFADVNTRFAQALEKGGVAQDQRASRAALLARELSEVNATDAAAAMIDRTILRPSIKAIDDKLKDQPAVDASLRHTIARLYSTLGLYQDAMVLQKRAVETRQRLFGDDDARTLASQELLADLYLSSGKADAAAAIFRDTLQRSIRILGPDNDQTLSLMSNLGNVLRGQGQFAEAEPLLRGALEGRRRTVGNEHRETLICLNTYGYLLIAQGKLAQTEPYWREAYETGRRVLGPDHPDTLIWTANMAGLMTELGKLDDAARLYREVSDGFRRVRGEEHPYTLGCLRGLSLVLTRQRKLDEAEAIITRVLEAQRRTLGDEHPETIDSLVKLGANQQRQGKLVESEANLRAALAASRRVLGNDNVATLDTMTSLADVLRSANKIEESNTLYLEQIAVAARTLGKEHQVYLTACLLFGDSLTLQKRYTQAEAYLREVVETRRRVSGPGHPETGYSLHSLGLLLKEQGKLPESEQAIREAIDILRTTLNKDSTNILSEQTSLAEVLLLQGKLPECEALIRDTLASLERIEAKDLLLTCGARLVLGELLTAQKHFEQAQALLTQTHRDISSIPYANPRFLEQSTRALANLYTAWNAAEPGKGYDTRAAEWTARLDATDNALLERDTRK